MRAPSRRRIADAVLALPPDADVDVLWHGSRDGYGLDGRVRILTTHNLVLAEDERRNYRPDDRYRIDAQYFDPTTGEDLDPEEAFRRLGLA